MIETLKHVTFAACALTLAGVALAFAPGARARTARRWVVDLLADDPPCPVCARPAFALPAPPPDDGDPHPRSAR